MLTVISYLLGRFIVVDSPAVKEEPEGGHWNSNTLGVRLLQLAHLCRHLHSEVDFVGILTNNFELDVLSGSVISSLKIAQSRG